MGYYLKCSHENNIPYYRSYTGQNCTEWLVDEMSIIDKHTNNSILKHVKSINVNRDIKYISPNCHVWETAFKSDDRIVRDHSNITEKFEGFTQTHFNLNFQNSVVIFMKR